MRGIADGVERAGFRTLVPDGLGGPDSGPNAAARPASSKSSGGASPARSFSGWLATSFSSVPGAPYPGYSRFAPDRVFAHEYGVRACPKRDRALGFLPKN